LWGTMRGAFFQKKKVPHTPKEIKCRKLSFSGGVGEKKIPSCKDVKIVVQ
jgi:DNA primase